MSDPAHPVRWRAAPPEAYAWAGEQVAPVLYHRHSGQTHFINPATALLLQHILREPQDAASATHALAEAHGTPADADLHREVEASLLRLEELGLVERVRE